jgi:hypothetical protein
MHEEPIVETQRLIDPPEFDDNMRDNFTKKAEALDEEIRNENNSVKKAKLLKTADSYYEAISELEGKSKAEAVDWIQVHSGGKKGAEMDDAVEVGGYVWSRQTACHVLSSWDDILGTVSYIISKEHRG